MDEGGHKGFADDDKFLGQGWDHFVEVKIQSWEDFYLDWLEEADPDNIHVIFFELISENLKDVLLDIVEFLDINDPSERRLDCVMKHSEGKFHRERDKSRELNEDPFSTEQRERIKLSISKVNSALISKGKPELPIRKYEYFHDR